MNNMFSFRRAAKKSFDTYFAPLTGAYKGIRSEFQRISLDDKRAAASEQQQKKRSVKQP